RWAGSPVSGRTSTGLVRSDVTRRARRGAAPEAWWGSGRPAAERRWPETSDGLGTPRQHSGAHHDAGRCRGDVRSEAVAVHAVHGAPRSPAGQIADIRRLAT